MATIMLEMNVRLNGYDVSGTVLFPEPFPLISGTPGPDIAEIIGRRYGK
jgi:hypothetical protein